MKALSGAQLLDLWEGGSRLHPLDRSLLVLRAAYPGEDAARWPLGRRNQALAALRCQNFGPHVDAWVACPACAEKLEFSFDARVMTAPQDARESTISAVSHQFRLPTSLDLVAMTGAPNTDEAAAALLDACCLDAPAAWPPEIISAVAAALSAADPMAETRLSLTCPACALDWEDNFDIGTFLWADIDSAARQLFLEVHVIASAYGWPEHEIVSLSPARRTAYVAMVEGR